MKLEIFQGEAYMIDLHIYVLCVSVVEDFTLSAHR